MIKPMLASDADLSKLKYPVIIQPKIDGARALNLDGNLTGRSLKPHRNKHVAQVFSKPQFLGLDGEMMVGRPTDSDLCRNTTSALSSIKGEPSVTWAVFDYLIPGVIGLRYEDRLKALHDFLQSPAGHAIGRFVYLVESKLVFGLQELLDQESQWLDEGYEGLIVRDPNGLHKQGRSTVKEGGLLRVKRFIEVNATVLELIEGQTNGNEAKLNELGLTERSSHQANMAPNGMLGKMICRLDEDVLDPGNPSTVLFPKGMIITVSPGNMPHSERLRYWLHPGELVLQQVKVKMFPKGVKDKPRFPTFVALRMESDKS
jgi:DNA ligase-1